MTQPYPFSAIVGQDEMKLALVLTAIDPGIGGVLVFGDRGTGKSTAVRALAALLPEVTQVSGCPVNSPSETEIPEWADVTDRKVVTRPTPVVDLPLGATEDRVTGSLDIERALSRGEKAFEPGLLARANRGYLYIDESICWKIISLISFSMWRNPVKTWLNAKACRSAIRPGLFWSGRATLKRVNCARNCSIDLVFLSTSPRPMSFRIVSRLFAAATPMRRTTKPS